MNLLAAINYDPSTAVAKSTASLLAMTALDTTNLRSTVTVPASGIIYWKLQTVLHGATTYPQVFLGVMESTTVRGRKAAMLGGGNLAATSHCAAWAEGMITGLTPGASITLDAAYGVDVVVASTNLRYGGPNNTTTDDAWGAISFELWDPRPLPTAAPGASGGVLISGSNSGTTTLAALTVTGALTVSDGVAITASTTNRSAFTATGNGLGHGGVFTSGSGATGDGLRAFAASTDGDGFRSTGTGAGVGYRITSSGTGAGLRIQGGSTSGDGISVTTTSGAGASITGSGSNAGLQITGGATGNGANIVGGGTSGDGLRVAGTGSGHGLIAVGVGTTKHGINATGGATTSNGINAVGGGVGHGIHATSGGGATGDGIRATAASTNGNGMNLVAVGTGDGLLATGGSSAGGDGIAGVAGGGVDIRGGITGSVTGSVSGSVGSVTAAVTVGTNNDKTGYALSSAGVTAIWAEVMEGAVTAVQMMRGFASALMGKASGLATTTAVYRDLGDTKDRITATVDGAGNRSAVTRDLT